MGSEEVLSVLAGFHGRSKRRSGHDRINLWQFPGKVSEKAQKIAAKHVATHQSTIHVGPGRSKQRKNHQNQANAVAAGGKQSVSNHSPTNRGGGWGGSSIGTAGMSNGDGSVGHAVHLAAVESVEAFLGDFVPEVQEQPPVVAALLSSVTGAEAGGKGGVEAHDGGDCAVPKKVSKWAAIGRAGKISARATAVCVEEVCREGWLFERSPLCVVGGCCWKKQRNWGTLEQETRSP